VTNLRAMPLSFYPGWAVVEGEALVEPGLSGTFDVLYGPGLMWLIDGESRVLNDLNAGSVPRDLTRYLAAGAIQGTGDTGSPHPHDAAGFIASPLRGLDDPAIGADFLRFYCACVWGEEGPFMPVESAGSPVLHGLDARDSGWLGRLRPLVVSRDGDELAAEGVIAYGRSLFEARLRVRDGRVRMEDDAPIAADVLPERVNAAPLRDLRRTQE
jgi:hypothetical protein